MPLHLSTPKVCQERVMKRLKIVRGWGWGGTFFLGGGGGGQLVYFKG